MEWTLREVTIHYLVNYLAWNDSNLYQLVLLALTVGIVAVGSVVEQCRRVIFTMPEKKIAEGLYAGVMKIRRKADGV